MSNTGRRIYTTLEEYYIDTGEPTGNTKPNTPGSFDYIPPTTDIDSCPVAVFSSSRTQSFNRDNCTSGQSGSSVIFTKTYESIISQQDADNKAASDLNYNTEGQLYANQNGTCLLPDYVNVVVEFKKLSPPTTGTEDWYRVSAEVSYPITQSIFIEVEVSYIDTSGMPNSSFFFLQLGPMETFTDLGWALQGVQGGLSTSEIEVTILSSTTPQEGSSVTLSTGGQGVIQYDVLVHG